MEEYIKYITKYFDTKIEYLKKELEIEDISIEEKQALRLKLEIITQLSFQIEYHVKSSEDKQVIRLQDLASMRRRQVDIKELKNKEKNIHIYELIKSTMPYIKALNKRSFTPFIEYLNNLCDKIDRYSYGAFENFPTEDEIKEVFEIYFHAAYPFKTTMFKECYERIEYLYYELLKLNNE